MRFLVPLALIGASLSFAQVQSWTIDSAHSAAQFSVRHLMVSTVRGDFSGLKGSVQFDPKDLSKTAVEATIDVATVNTREPNRDKHLKSADFFDVEKFPAMTFKSKSVAKAGNNLRLTGDLTLHGVTRTVVFDVEGPTPEVNAGRAIKSGATATAKISRKDFGMTWNRAIEAGGVTVGDEVTITIDVELNRPVAAR